MMHAVCKMGKPSDLKFGIRMVPVWNKKGRAVGLTMIFRTPFFCSYLIDPDLSPTCGSCKQIVPYSFAPTAVAPEPKCASKSSGQFYLAQ
jgi:hypothetical protein